MFVPADELVPAAYREVQNALVKKYGTGTELDVRRVISQRGSQHLTLFLITSSSELRDAIGRELLILFGENGIRNDGERNATFVITNYEGPLRPEKLDRQQEREQEARGAVNRGHDEGPAR